MVQHNRSQLLMIWVLWASLFMGIIASQFAFGGGIPTGENAPRSGLDIAVMLAIGQIGVASVIRWVFIPRAKNPVQVLVLMVLGLALSEAVGYYSLFIEPPDQPRTKLA